MRLRVAFCGWILAHLGATSLASEASTAGALYQRIQAARTVADGPAALVALEQLRTIDTDFWDENDFDYLFATVNAEVGQYETARRAFERVIARRRPLADRAALRIARLPGLSPKAALAAVQRFATRYPESAVMREGRVAEIVALERTGRPLDADRLTRRLPRAIRRDADHALLRSATEPGRIHELARRLLRGRGTDAPGYDASVALLAAGDIASIPIAERVAIAESLYLHRRFPEAIRILTATTDDGEFSPEAGFLLGRAAMKAGDDVLARSVFESVCGRGGVLGERAAYQVARIALACGEEPDALDRFAALAASREAGHRVAPEALLKLVRIHAAAGRFREANSASNELDRRFGVNSPWSAQAAISLAVAHLVRRNPASALSVLTVVRKNSEYDRESAWWRGRALVAVGRPREALGVLALAAAGNDLIAAAARREFARVDPALGVEPALIASARSAVAGGDVAAARTALARLPSGIGIAAKELSCELSRRQPSSRDPDDSDDWDEPLPYASRAHARGHLAAAKTLFYLGFPREAADELEAAGASGVGRLRAMARLLSAAGDHAGALRQAERVRGRLKAGYRAECLPDSLAELLYPKAWQAIVERAARAHAVDPRLVWAVMREESRFDAQAHSAAGARGLMQFITDTAVRVGNDIGVTVTSPEQLYEPGVIIPLGAAYLAELLRLFDGREEVAVAAYNAGEEMAFEWAERAGESSTTAFLTAIEFAETRAYVDRVLTTLAAYRSR